jgi:hypothetical protein
LPGDWAVHLLRFAALLSGMAWVQCLPGDGYSSLPIFRDCDVSAVLAGAIRIFLVAIISGKRLKTAGKAPWPNFFWKFFQVPY